MHCCTLLYLFLALTLGCNSSSFSGSTEKKDASPPPPPVTSKPPVPEAPAPPPPPGNPQAPRLKTLNFDVATHVTPIDIVWIIDNSPSMAAVIAVIQEQFDLYMEKQLARPDEAIRFALLSAGSTPGARFNLGVSLPDSAVAAGHVQVNVPVGSTNSLALAAAASCEVSATDLSAATIQGVIAHSGTITLCGQEVTLGPSPFPEGDSIFGGIFNGGGIDRQAVYKILEGPAQVESARGRLLDFHRENAHRVYMFVTDDDSGAVSDQQFLPMLAAAGVQRPLIYAIRGTPDRVRPEGTLPTGGDDACSVTAAGQSFDRLVTATGGEAFDICGREWPDLEGMTRMLKRAVQNTFPLNLPAGARVKRVLLDGQPLGPGLWSLNGGILTVDPEAARQGSTLGVEITW